MDTVVACLCAAWCGSCREYEPLFRAVAARWPQLQWRWIDIEDEADRLPDIDVENFPTLAIAHGDALLFVGAVTPHAGTLERLVSSAVEGEFPPKTDAASRELAQAIAHP